MPLLEVRNLTVNHHKTRPRSLSNLPPAVADFSMSINVGERLGLVGESGCGKSSLCRTLLGLHQPSAGDVFWKGQSMTAAPPSRRRRMALEMQMVFQDPGGSLNPRMRAGQLLTEALWLNGYGNASSRRTQAVRLLEKVGLDVGAMHRFPHAFSGGQRQRLALARVLAATPRLLIADEPVSALDVVVQAQILKVLLDLQQEQGFALLFVAHDLAVVRMICDRALVMYRGRLMEEGPVDVLFSRPAHPYTRKLLDAVPDIDRALLRRIGRAQAPALPSSPDTPPNAETDNGCPWHPQCPNATPVCRHEQPVWRTIASGHFSACHLAEPVHASAGAPTGTVPEKGG